MPNTSDIKIKIREIDKNNNEVKFSWEDSLGKRHGKNLKLGVSLSEILSDFGNLNVVGIETKTILLSNGHRLSEGDYITPKICR